jgi:TatD DNase family protein
MIDTHAHIYSAQYEGSNEEIVKNAMKAGVSKIFMPNTDPESVAGMLALEKAFPGVCYPMIGLHPCDVFETFENDLETLKGHLQNHKFYAIGEIGMDLYHDVTFRTQQEKALRIQIQWALEYDLPIIIHSRNANDETMAVIKEFKDPRIRGIFHCFSGTLEQAQAMIDMGFFLGIGGVVTFKNSGLDKIVFEIPLEHLVLETDAPYLAPVPFRGKRNEPGYLNYITEKIADIKEISPLEVKQVSTANALRIFGLGQ